MKKLSIVPYDPSWVTQFEKEAAFLNELLDAEVHHIGSTAVEGLMAKPKIDILCIVDDLKSSLKLEKLGYRFMGEINIPLRYGFAKREGCIANIHVVEKGHPFIELNLTFRDYLREHKKAREAYVQLKRSLLEDPKAGEKVAGRLNRYNLGKNAFIKETLERAGFQRLMINFPYHHEEVEAYNRFCEGKEGLCFVLYHGTKIVGGAHLDRDSNLQIKCTSFKEEFEKMLQTIIASK